MQGVLTCAHALHVDVLAWPRIRNPAFMLVRGVSFDRRAFTFALKLDPMNQPAEIYMRPKWDSTPLSIVLFQGNKGKPRFSCEIRTPFRFVCFHAEDTGKLRGFMWDAHLERTPPAQRF